MKFLKQNSLAIIISLGILLLYLFRVFQVDGYLSFDPNGQLLNARLQEFITLFLSVVVEAFPFVILGVIISVLVALFVSEKFFHRIIPKNRFLSHIVISLLGFLMPVCECGNVPVARRLISKKFSVSHAVTFLLAAPILNPITIWSTYEAFGSDISIVLIRIGAAFFVANFIGILISFKRDQNSLLTEKFYKEVCEIQEHEGHNHSKIQEGLEIFRNEFLEVMKLLVLGAAFAAISQVFIPREIIASIGQSPFLSIIAMILFAFIISICSNVDAFVALPYASTFTLGSIVSFLVFGPMIDMKILTMLRSSFKLKLLIFITVFVTLFSILIGLIVNYFI